MDPWHHHGAFALLGFSFRAASLFSAPPELRSPVFLVENQARFFHFGACAYRETSLTAFMIVEANPVEQGCDSN
jgi:hypothetical protein